MKNTIVCIFAHPDDEAFGPGGTIAQLARDNNVYILCATRGQAGQDATPSEKKLAKRRSDELKASAKILGVKKVYFLGFRDGYLSNSIYHQIAEKIKEKLEKLKPVQIMTVSPSGVSGHLDHIAISYISTFVFYQLAFIKTMWQHAILEERARELRKNYFIYVPTGYEKEAIDKIVDISDVWNIKVNSMLAHKSQQADAKRILKSQENYPKEEYFLIISK